MTTVRSGFALFHNKDETVALNVSAQEKNGGVSSRNGLCQDRDMPIKIAASAVCRTGFHSVPEGTEDKWIPNGMDSVLWAPESFLIPTPKHPGPPSWTPNTRKY